MMHLEVDMPPEDTQEQFMYPPQPSRLAPGSYTGRITNARVEGERLHMTPGLAQVTDGITLCITDGDLGDPGPKYQDVVWVITRKGGRRAWMNKVVHAYGS